MTGKLLLFLFFLLTVNPAFTQYTLNGSASKNDCHCYTLTNDAFGQTGSVWNNNKINLTQSFDFSFDVFLGCADSDGADGIAFVLQPISTSVGTQGNGLGYSGVKPSVGITIDTWQNGSPAEAGPDGDPPFDHIAIQLNGDLDHKDSIAPLPINNIAGPVTALAGSDNIEDCQWHIFRIKWDEPTKTLSAYMDGALRVSATRDFINDVFGGDPMVFWGFTGSTGGAKNLQQMCTSLKPVFKLLPGQKKCIGEKISFLDSTISFAPLQKRSWNFGDGSPVDSVSVNPVHKYVAAGEYTVTQTVVGADGCTEINTQNITIGSIPIAGFTFNNACAPNSSVNFTDTSTAAFGTIDNWFWDFGNGDTGTLKQSSKIYTAPGPKTVKLAVKSLEGCASDTAAHVLEIYAKPVADFTFDNNKCVNSFVQFNGSSTVTDGSITTWHWSLDAVSPSFAQNPLVSYVSPGQRSVSLVTTSADGCNSDTVSKLLNIIPQPVAYFKNDPVCLSAPAMFTDSSYITGGDIVNSRWWDLGNGKISTAQQPATSYSAAGTVIVELVVKSNNGCISDTLKKMVNIESPPVAKFGYTLPLCENRTIGFADSSVIRSGTIRNWWWSFDNGSSATTQNATTSFSHGSHLVKLAVQNSNGCNSDTSAATIFINPTPTIDFSVTDACKNVEVNFTGVNKTGSNVTEWKWNFDNGQQDTTQQVAHVYENAGVFAIQLSGISLEGCPADTIQKNITIYATNAFAGNDTIAATNQPLQLTASGGTSYHWLPVTGLSNPDIFNPVAINNKDREYILKAFTQAGCESFDTIRIKIYDGPEIYVPAAFTPNGDGLNEVLRALPVGVKQFNNFTIYNRLGQVVFTTRVYSNGWDGFYKGKAQSTGAYIWTASAVGLQGNNILRKGTVMLIR